ncbi:hypothetical protein KSP40_PGU021817 [Platanthera guangdongensis]|uniref:Uncharacterized protein n=1 Tax=Platanthera guangdongensis TaxID=2320717 RepID=A0ABR2LK39_9ASPA
MRRWKIPEFESWGYYEGYEDLFNVPVAMPVKCRLPYTGHYRQKAPKMSGAGTETNYTKEQKQRKQRKVCNAADCPPRRPRAAMAVDEDLYKIPPELLYKKPKTVSPSPVLSLSLLAPRIMAKISLLNIAVTLLNAEEDAEETDIRMYGAQLPLADPWRRCIVLPPLVLRLLYICSS